MEPFILDLDKVTKENKKVGGKGANLGEMVQAGLPVPPGFVVSTDAYDYFIEENKLKEKIASALTKVDTENPETVQQVSAEIENLVLNSKVPEKVEQTVRDAYLELSVGKEIKKVGGAALDMVKAGRETFVAVRSSGTAEDLADASFAGQMKTLLNIRGAGGLVKAVKECWASLYTPRAIFYRETHGIKAEISIGVIVQKMVNSEKAGVLFTVDPATNDTSKMVIEGSWGLGESVVSGLVTPDIYVLDRGTGQLVKKVVSRKKTYRIRDPNTGATVELKTPEDKLEAQVLNEGEIAKLWELGRKVENHYRKPQDIEWCQERDKMYLVQTRPITTLEREAARGEVPQDAGQVVVEGIPASPGVAKGAVKVIRELSGLSGMQKGNVLVATMTNPDMVPYMRMACAIVTDEGGSTSHAAIVSRELGLPCIVGAGNATTVLKDGQEITVDAGSGKVYSGAVAVQEAQAPGEPHGHTEALPEGSTATAIKVNIAFPETAERVADRADGVGLLRAEHLLTGSGKHPVHLARTDPEELTRIIAEGVGQIAKAFYPKPVWYRTLDARTDEFRRLEGGEEEPTEANPMLGWHGIRRALDEPDVFRCELAAIKRLHEQGLNNVAVMLPFLVNLEEFRKAKGMVDFQVEMGIMVETPASVMILDSLCEAGIDFVSIGSNDLTQLTLGVDRNNSHIAGLYDEMNPAVLKLIEMTVKTCRKHKVKSSICGEAGSRPEMAKKLVEYGISSISCEMDAIDTVRETVAKAEKKLILDTIRNRQ